jgi:hypothetical protein
MPAFYVHRIALVEFRLSRIWVWVLLTAGSFALLGCAAPGVPLNSDLIERRFGSYGVQVRSADPGRRVASLYSGQAPDQTTRTYAVTEFLSPDNDAYRDLHQRIVAGASIGSTFRGAGFDIRKQSLFIGELEVPATYTTIADLMQVELPATMAVHQYLFIVSTEESSSSYARITEVHHPDFLTVSELEEMFGEILFDDSNRDSIHDFIGPPPGK